MSAFDPYIEQPPLLEEDEPVEPKRHKPTDDELGDELMQEWDGQYAWIYGAWHKYQNGVWKPENRMGLQFWRVLIQHKANGIRPSSGKAKSIDDYCQLNLMVDDEKINQGYQYINLRNGVYNLEAGRLEEHRPELFMTNQLDFDYDPQAKCEEWSDFLQTVLVRPNGLPDGELIRLVQEAFYYSLTADTSFRISFWLVGPSHSGKSTLLNVLISLAGDGHVGIDLDSLKDNQYQLAGIAGKRVVTFTEPDSRTPLADGQYKKLVSRDTISARQIHGKPFNFIPVCKLWGAMNNTPRVLDRSDAVFNRVIIIPMNKVIPESERDGQLEDKLKTESSGIFNWILAGGKRLKQQGHFTKAQQSEEARAEYKSENDAEGSFIEECTQRGADYQVHCDELYKRYKEWCSDNGHYAKSKKMVSKDWKRLGFQPHRMNSGIHYKGLQIPQINLSNF